jgi:peptide-methionine (S)-S-oxide reductase
LFWVVDVSGASMPCSVLVPGVAEVTAGYSGGHMKDPDYKSVCTGETGHAEVVQVQFDPTKVRLDDLLDLFWKVHDPTTLHRQGADVGTQYRSVIFYSNEAQQGDCRGLGKKGAESIYVDPIVTQVSPLDVFYAAEEYHQDYFAIAIRMPATVPLVVAPKVQQGKDDTG